MSESMPHGRRRLEWSCPPSKERVMPTPAPLRRTGNPGLNAKTFANLPRPLVGEARMTLQGTINKSFLMVVVLLASALWPWSQYMSTGDASAVSTSVLIGVFGGLILAVVISFKANLAPYLSLPYAALEGLAMGGFSAMLERRYPGIAIQAVALTFGVLVVLLVAYRTGL